MLVAEEAVEIRVLRRQGKSIREIARMLDVSRNTVRRYLRVEGLPRYREAQSRARVYFRSHATHTIRVTDFVADFNRCASNRGRSVDLP